MVTYRSIYRYVYTFIGIHRYTQTSIHTYISFLCQLRRLKTTISQQQWAHSVPKLWPLIPFSNKRNLDSLQKWLIQWLWQYDRIMCPPIKDVHILTLRTCKYYFKWWKGIKVADRTKVADQQTSVWGDYHGFSR